MDTELILSNILNPPILFFFLGMMAVFLKSDLDIPLPLSKFFSLYLLLSIGLEGGVHLAESGINREIVVTLIAAVAMALIVPFYTFFVLRARLDVYNSAAIAATYGSISAVTFITAAAAVQKLGWTYGGHLVAAMALMESPAVIVGVMMVRLSFKEKGSVDFSWKELFRDSFFNGSVFLLLGSLLIGAATGEAGWNSLKPFSKEIFKGMLAFFLLDMGIVAAKRIRDIKKSGVFLIAFALIIPIINAAIGMGIAGFIGLDRGDALLFTILCGSASYIAVPAAMRMAVPEANPSLYVPMSLAITFPYNIVVGIPLYSSIINWFWS